MIQQVRIGDEALTWIEQKLRANLLDGISPQQIRIQAGKETLRPARNRKFYRQPGARPIPEIAWSRRLLIWMQIITMPKVIAIW